MLGTLLRPLSWCYGRAVACCRAKQRRTPPVRLPVPVISVGNISVGGTGKTETAARICDLLRGRGFKPAVLSRGYWRQSREPVLVVSRGEGPCVPVAAAGDEPFLLARRLPGVPILVGADRIASGTLAVETFGCNVLVLDDGFQRRDQVARDLDVVLVDATDPWAGKWLLPAGRLREPLESLKEADAFLITRANQKPWEPVRDQLSKLAPGKPVFPARHVPVRLVSLQDQSPHALDFLANRKVLAVSGIAKPEAFARTLEEVKAELTGHFAFRDHHWYSAQDLKRIAAQATSLKSEIVTTAKDAVRLESAGQPLKGWVLEIRLELMQGQDEWEKLITQAVKAKK